MVGGWHESGQGRARRCPTSAVDWQMWVLQTSVPCLVRLVRKGHHSRKCALHLAMASIRSAWISAFAAALLSVPTSAQQQPQPKEPDTPPPAAVQVPARPPMDFGQLTDYVKDQFGASFRPAPVQPRTSTGDPVRGTSPVVLLVGDLDGDGVEDAVIVAKSVSPMADEQPFAYKVIDPYDAFFGYGNPRFTAQFAESDKEGQRLLLIVHSWRSAKPKAKFVVINLPFDNLTMSRGTLKKKSRSFLIATEVGIMQSTLFWDGKKYRYAPGTGEEE